MPTAPVTPEELASAIRNIPDFPKPGIQFKDITTVLGDARLLAGCIDLIAAPYVPGDLDAVIGIDARGFILAGAVAYKLRAAFVPVRKKGKLPFQTIEQSYDLEYGASTIAMHVDAIKSGSRVLLVDDLLATGGTAAAAIALLAKLDAQVLEVCFLIELSFLHGRAKLNSVPLRSLVVF